MKSHKISDNEETHCCPSCGQPLTVATGISTEDTPKKDDITICFNCGEILLFNENLTTSKISNEKLKEIKIEVPDIFIDIMRISRSFKEKNENK